MCLNSLFIEFLVNSQGSLDSAAVFLLLAKDFFVIFGKTVDDNWQMNNGASIVVACAF